MSKPRLSVAVFLATILFAVSASAASVSLAWDPNKEPEVTGYVVLVGSTPGGTDQTVDVGAQPAWTFTSGVAGKDLLLPCPGLHRDGDEERLIE